MSMPESPDTKKRLFMAGIKVFAREGFKGATVRDICKEAGAANATAVNYYFGGKAGLYRAILELAFAENRRLRKEREAILAGAETPEERLRSYLGIMLSVGFEDKPLLEDVVTIVLREMTKPSEHLDPVIEEHVRADNAELGEILRGILGPDAPDYLIRDSGVSIAGQLFYYMAFWPMFSKVFPEHPGINAYKDTLLEHIMRFSMAGLEATAQALRSGRIPKEQPN